MIKLLQLKNKHRAFHKATFKELPDDVANPLRGWFDLYSFELNEDPLEFERRTELDINNGLVLLLIDISAFKNGNLEEKELLKLENILCFFRNNNKDIILRVTYDHAGKGMDREPFSFDIVKKHAEKIAEFVSKHHKDIFLYQGLLVGRWGEMHTTRFSTPEKLQQLYEIFENRISGSVYMAVRKPVQLRLLKNKPYQGEKFDPGTLGVFNDGMFGSETDLGTYDNSDKECSWDKPWNRENELKFMTGVAEKVPMGGEAIFGEGFVSTHTLQDYIYEMSLRHITYLNRHHDIKLINYWKKLKVNYKGVWNGSSYFDYIGAHLGYRFFVKNAGIYKEKNECTLKITVENLGFASIYGKTDLFIKIKENSGTELNIPLGNILNEIRSGERYEICAGIPEVKGMIYLYAVLSVSGKSVKFVNQEIHPEGVLLGNII